LKSDRTSRTFFNRAAPFFAELWVTTFRVYSLPTPKVAGTIT
jgi:hypothetical protein